MYMYVHGSMHIILSTGQYGILARPFHPGKGDVTGFQLQNVHADINIILCYYSAQNNETAKCSLSVFGNFLSHSIIKKDTNVTSKH